MAGLVESEKPDPLQDVRLARLKIHPPLVTIVVTSYNYEKYIIACLQSVAKQTYTNWECLIVDDNSKDQSIPKIQEFLTSPEAQGKFTLLQHEQNMGQMAAMKTGIQHAKGVFTVLLDADDLLLEDFLQIHLQVHMQYEPVAFTSSNQCQINEKDELIAGCHADLKTDDEVTLVRSTLLYHPFWTWATASSMMFRTVTLQLILPSNCEPLRICADNYLAHFSNLIGNSLLIRKTLGCYRRHGNNFFSTNPIIGGMKPTGAHAKHPQHETVRAMILAHLLERYTEFHTILWDKIFILTLMRVASPREIWTIRKRNPECLKEKSRFFLWKLGFLAFLSARIAKVKRDVSAVLQKLGKRNREVL